MVGSPEMRAAFDAAERKFQKLNPSGSDDDFLNLFRVECLGSPDLPLAPARPVLRPFATLSDEPLDVEVVSTVVTISALVRLVSWRDKKAFRKKGVRFVTPSGARGSFIADHVAEKLANRLARLPVDQRRFEIADDASHGRPYVWFTAKSDLEAALARRTTFAHTMADVARDLLGLVHHGPVSRDTGGANHLFALHLPAKVVMKATHMRPAAPQAFDNRRFVLRFEDADLRSSDDWGQTIDLDYFATRSAGKPIGGRERILLRLQASVVPAGTTISFDYLGTVSAKRGEVSGRDDDQAFLDLVGRGRDVDALLQKISA